MRGIRAMRSMIVAAGTELVHQYVAKDPDVTRFNTNELEIRSLQSASRDSCSASGPATFLMSRASAFEFAEGLSIPSHCEMFTLRLTGAVYFNYSAGAQLLDALMRKLRGKKLRIRIGSDSVGLIDTLRDLADGNPAVSIEQI